MDFDEQPATRCLTKQHEQLNNQIFRGIIVSVIKNRPLRLILKIGSTVYLFKPVQLPYYIDILKLNKRTEEKLY